MDDLVQDNNVVLSLVRLPRRLYDKAVPVPKEATQHDAQPSTRSCQSEAKQRNFEIDIACLDFQRKVGNGCNSTVTAMKQRYFVANLGSWTAMA
jgi:hypothetical protein